MAPAREQGQAVLGVFRQLGLWQNSGARGNDRVGGDDKSVALAGQKFLGGEAMGVGARGFPFAGRLVDVRRKNLGGLNADLPEQFQPARAGGA